MIRKIKIFLYEENMARLESLIRIGDQINQYVRPSLYLCQLAKEVVNIVKENNDNKELGGLIDEDHVSSLLNYYEEVRDEIEDKYDFEDISYDEFAKIHADLIEIIDAAMELINMQTIKVFEKRKENSIMFDA